VRFRPIASYSDPSNLQVLSLSGVPLTDQGLASLKTLPKLNRLDIKGCGLLFEDLDAFQVARPAIELKRSVNGEP
jgi:hypothetical protein